MGKVGGYLELDRKAHGERPARETVADFAEFALPLSETEQRAQAGRCMYCGVAFCQVGAAFGKARTSGCPLHNLIPEWNDLLWRGLWDDAAARLNMTNPFPEFTGRVCPALCEVACNLGLNQEATTIRDDERAISDHLWAQGGPAPLAPAAEDAPRVAVVGSGPAGLACSWELARRGAQVTLVERDDRAGGLLMYGIPNMKLPKGVVERRVALMRASGIDVRCGVDASKPEVAEDLLAENDAVVIATGARQPRALKVPGAELAGVHFAVEYLTAQTKALLDGTETPLSAAGLDVVVIGGGDTGTDCVATALRQGARSVRQLEFLPEPPETRRADNLWPEWPAVKKTDYGQVEARELQGADPRTWACDTLEVLGEDGRACGLKVVALDWSGGKPRRIEGSERRIQCQLVLLAMGFVGHEQGVFDALGVSNKVRVCGDARTGSSLVVNAISDGLACAADLAADLAL